MDTYDVLVVGAGPSGLMAAVALCNQGVRVGIIEKNTSRPARGRADGLEPRTLEILDSYGLLDSWWRHASHTVELSVWVASQQQELQRILRRCNSSLGTSKFHETTMDQAVIERAMENYLLQRHNVTVQYATEPTDMQLINNDIHGEDFAMDVTVQKAGLEHRVKTKYVIGADGAHSWTRKRIGIEMLGAHTSHIWGVADIRPLTDFPDIRSRNIIHKEGCGTLMFIPREARMVRMYVQLDEEATKHASSNDPTATLDIAKKILEPYNLDTRSVYWSAKYRIQQLLASSYSAFDDRVFIMGDAAHTHSPKAGMGLNMSVQDAYNLAWKLAAVVNKEASPQLLTTYELERRPIAQTLLEFDRDFNTLFHSPLSNSTPDEYRAAIAEAVTTESGDISGVAALYLDQGIMNNPGLYRQDLATRITIGKRIPHGTFVNHADGRSIEVHDVLPSNGQWRLFAFPGDMRNVTARERFETLGKTLKGRDSPLQVYTRNGVDSNSILEVFTVHTCPRHEMSLLDLPEVFHPWNAELGWDYGKVFTDEQAYQNPINTGHLYKDYGIAQEGCVVLLRPDQHVCVISKMEDSVELCTQYLSRWFYKRGRQDSMSPM